MSGIDESAESLYERTTREDIEEWLEQIEQALEADEFEPTDQDADRIEAILSHIAVVQNEKPLTPRALVILREIRDRAISRSSG